MNVEPLLIARDRPGNDVRGAQQRRLGDAGERKAALRTSLNTSCLMRRITSRSACVRHSKQPGVLMWKRVNGGIRRADRENYGHIAAIACRLLPCGYVTPSEAIMRK